MKRLLLMNVLVAALFISACSDSGSSAEDEPVQESSSEVSSSSSAKKIASSSSSDVQSSSEEEEDSMSSGATEPDEDYPYVESSSSSFTSTSSTPSSSSIFSSSSSSSSSMTSSSMTSSSISSSSLVEQIFSSSEEEQETLRRIPVEVFDWLHGNEGDGVDGNGNPEYGVSADFGSGGCGSGYMTNMVEPMLGSKGVPIRAASFPEKCNITDHLDYWFLPETLAVDASGNTLTNMTCRNLYLSKDDEDFWFVEASKDSVSTGNEMSGGLFLLDDFKYLDSAKTILNPYYDQLRGGSDNGRHNFGFTMKFQAVFEYIPGQYFEFEADDDTWVFINNRLVMDFGGQQATVSGAVDLDTLGLMSNQTYPLHIFHAERHTSMSDFRIRTSIDLKPDLQSPCR